MLKELQELADYVTDKEKIPFVIIQVKNVKKGRARITTRKITIPKWAESNISYLYYYLLHEVAHFICCDKISRYCGHNKDFKIVEKRLLKDFDLIPIYKKAYVKELKNLQGQSIYKRT